MMVEDVQGNVANFIAKLWKMLSNPATSDIMHWSPSGKSFVIENQISFITKLLPMHFKHTNMGSFVRQLNLYDFHKNGGEKHQDLEYAQKYFQKDRPNLLKFIKRKLPKAKRVPYTTFEQEQLDKLSQEVVLLKNEQEAAGTKLGVLQQENLTLLRQMAHLHSKHNEQTQVLRKIIELLIPFVNSYNNVRRRSDADSSSRNFFEIDPDLVQKLEAINRSNWRYKPPIPTTSQDNLQLYTSPSSPNYQFLNTNLPNFKELLTSTNLPPGLEETVQGLVELYDDNDDDGKLPENINDALSYLDNDLRDLITDNVLMDCNLLDQNTEESGADGGTQS